MSQHIPATGLLDSRVTGEDGSPVRVLRLYRGWFRVSRAAGGSGVVLAARIPGMAHTEIPGIGHTDTRHDDQAAATVAAAKIYAAYCTAIEEIAR